MFLNVVLAQLKVGYDEIELAFDELQSFLNQNKPASNSLLVLPEMWPSGFNRDKLSHFIAQSDELLNRLKDFAQKYQIYIAVPIPIKVSPSSEKAFNSFVCLSPKGKLIGEYRKLHLFPLTNESSIFQAGQRPTLVEIEGVKVGFATCYDIRFPEMFRRYAEEGADLVVVSACFPDPRQMDWSTLLRARAIENQYFVAGVNAVATEIINGQELTYFGHSAVIDPKGNERVALGREPALSQVNLDISEVSDWRNHIHFIEDRAYVFQK